MDNRLTKKRLSEFFAYEWITMIIVIVVAIVVWEFVYTVASVRLTVGQQFKFYYDEKIDGYGSSAFYEMMAESDALSYDVLDFTTETLTEDVGTILSARLSIYEGDVIFTDITDYSKEEGADANTSKEIRLKSLVDSYDGYDFISLRNDAINYLKGFLPDGTVIEGDIEFENLSKEKIESYFRSRMKKDNRFRKEEQILSGIKLEEERIKKLCEDVKQFSYLLSLGDTNPELFYNYTRFEQSYESETNAKYKEQFESALNREKSLGKENVPYALCLSALKGGEGKTDPSTYFKLKGKETAENVALMVFNFKEQQPHLQYEVISFINQIVKNCSTILD